MWSSALTRKAGFRVTLAVAWPLRSGRKLKYLVARGVESMISREARSV